MTCKLLTIGVMAFASVLPTQANTISLNPLSSPTVGSSFDVVVQLTNVFAANPGDAVAAFGFNVAVGNPSVLSYTGETIGALFDDFSGAFPGSPGVVGIATAGFLEAGDFTEPLVLATLHFLATASGPSTIGITTDLSDPNQGLFYLTAGSTSLNSTTTVNVSGATATPEPAAGILGGLALAGLLIRGRLRRTMPAPVLR